MAARLVTGVAIVRLLVTVVTVVTVVFTAPFLPVVAA